MKNTEKKNQILELVRKDIYNFDRSGHRIITEIFEVLIELEDRIKYLESLVNEKTDSSPQ